MLGFAAWWSVPILAVGLVILAQRRRTERESIYGSAAADGEGR